MEGSDSGQLYIRYSEDLEQLAQHGKDLSESYIYKTLHSVKNDKEKVIYYLTQTFSKPNTFDWEKINLTLMHLVASSASDSAKSVLTLLTDLIKVIMNTVDDVGLVLELKTKAQRTPLMSACQKGNLEAVKILIEIGQADYKVRTETGTPIVLAAESGNIDLLNYLQRLPNSPSLNEGDLAGVTVLYVACYNHRVDMVKYLINETDLDIMRQSGPN